MNSFFRFNGNNTVWLLLSMTAASTVLSFSLQGFNLFLLIPPLFAGIFCVLYFRQTNKELKLIKCLFRFSKEIQKGNLEYRITHIDTDADLYELAWNFNEAMDQIETYIHEVGTCFESASPPVLSQNKTARAKWQICQWSEKNRCVYQHDAGKSSE